MASWDDDDFNPQNDEPDVASLVVMDKWEGEDEDSDGLKENWDDDDEEVKKDAEVVPAPVAVKKKKRPIAEIIKEKEEKRKKELLERQNEIEASEEVNRELTPEEQLAERLKSQRLQEEADLEIAKDAFGVTQLPGQKTLDNFEPTNKDEFTEFSSMLVAKLSKYEHESHYSIFLEHFFRDCCAALDHEDIKRIANSLQIVASEKLKLSKAAKGKKKGAAKKDALKAGKATKNDTSYDDYYDEYEDFM